MRDGSCSLQEKTGSLAPHVALCRFPGAWCYAGGGELGLPGGLPLVTLVLALLLLETFQTVKIALVMLQAWLGIPLQKTRQEVSSLEHKAQILK